ncbi:excinuclease ABC subunit UvrA [Natronincola ferrireducens]|uniref:UvrABC system protein A n=1 Tax=Natronincola ferrireducens TaxID=393762 RepID=A0A1G9A9G7_9FIRM|nr:excinuclease ABC subunit UvrA [Natronincola ferrireducens]SDK24006.1 excinuclease ABC subunit A [Natronincola ferrireducens]
MKNIEVISARENNLKDISVYIPVNKITVVTGVSGSGKSSLVFDTIYAESERMFLESISTNMQNITSMFSKPNVYSINNLLPSIAISQKHTNRNPRSSVGTITDISRFIRLLFARVGKGTSDQLYNEGDFSYNNPKVWCDTCRGTGESYLIDYSKVIGDENESLKEGAILYWKQSSDNYYEILLKEACEYYNINMNIPIKDLEKDKFNFLLNGKSDCKFKIRYKNYKNKYRTKSVEFKGALLELKEKLQDIDTPSTYKSIQKYLKKDKCYRCNGLRLKQEILTVKICDENISTLEQKPLLELKKWMLKLKENIDTSKKQVVYDISQEIIKRINNLEQLGLGYLSLSRSVPTLSGGEAQRVRLANQLACNLSGLLYVLDEPTMGLHSSDIDGINRILHTLKDKGNTILLVEHNSDIMLSADNIIDMGVGGGIYGGTIVSEGSPNKIKNDDKSLTGKYLSGKERIDTPSIRRKSDSYLFIQGANYNNIQEEDFAIPLHSLVSITGVSGAGKSTFTDEILEPSLSQKKNINCGKIEGAERIKKVVKVDQNPIGRSPKSNVATFTGIFDLIRDLYSKADLAKKKGLTKSHFSFNLSGGRCEKCQGSGQIKIDMSFMADTYILCDECNGKRYTNDVLEIMYNEKNISDVLEMTVLEAYEFFNRTKKVRSILKCLIDVGLNYIKLGQSAVTLSGGEAQRVKLAKYLSDDSATGNLYILDEPTVGLHFHDIKKLISLMNEIVDRGNSMIVVEHNIELIKSSDYIIDMGPKGGPEGGQIIDVGTPEEIVKNRKALIADNLIESLDKKE